MASSTELKVTMRLVLDDRTRAALVALGWREPEERREYANARRDDFDVEGAVAIPPWRPAAGGPDHDGLSGVREPQA